VVDDDAHRLKHGLEVHLPFLQRRLGRFRLVPLAVGTATPAQVEAVLDRFAGDPQALMVISSDLSHYHDEATARSLDAETGTQIETLSTAGLTPDQACGARAINGMLRRALRHDLRATTLDRRTSAAASGETSRVVGYGAWSLLPNDADQIAARDRRVLLDVAAHAIRNGLAGGGRPQVAEASFGQELRNRRACFVTLKSGERLRGCVGSLRPQRALVEDAAWNAYGAAFEDPRFPPLQADALAGLTIGVSVLGVPAGLAAADAAELRARLRPGRDGLILADGDRHAVFLPQVWAHFDRPADFVRALKCKAGLDDGHWSPTLRAERFSCESFEAPVAALDPGRSG
jgi:AmmeMemoRadiSam system protein A